jgi:transposase InsO family protein
VVVRPRTSRLSVWFPDGSKAAKGHAANRVRGVRMSQAREALRSLTIEQVLIAPRSPWQNPFVERLIGSIRRDLLDHVIVFGERQLLRSYFDYYHGSRCHQALDGDSPIPRAVEPPLQGKVVAMPMVGGLHHRYRRCG